MSTGPLTSAVQSGSKKVAMAHGVVTESGRTPTEPSPFTWWHRPSSSTSSPSEPAIAPRPRSPCSFSAANVTSPS
jgi:hypothetical protein